MKENVRMQKLRDGDSSPGKTQFGKVGLGEGCRVGEGEGREGMVSSEMRQMDCLVTSCARGCCLR